MNNTKIAHAKDSEGEVTAKCYRRSLDGSPLSFAKRVDEKRLLSLIEEHELIILKEDKRVYASMAYTPLWGKALFGKNDTYRKESDVLDSFPYNDEEVVFLDFLFVDPSFRHKGYGSTLLKDLFHRYENASVITVLFEDDEEGFFTRYGFIKTSVVIEDEENRQNGGRIYVRPFMKEGLCSKPLF